jgi:hypothetical protein
VLVACVGQAVKELMWLLRCRYEAGARNEARTAWRQERAELESYFRTRLSQQALSSLQRLCYDCKNATVLSRSCAIIGR